MPILQWFQGIETTLLMILGFLAFMAVGFVVVAVLSAIKWVAKRIASIIIRHPSPR